MNFVTRIVAIRPWKIFNTWQTLKLFPCRQSDTTAVKHCSIVTAAWLRKGAAAAQRRRCSADGAARGQTAAASEGWDTRIAMLRRVAGSLYSTHTRPSWNTKTTGWRSMTCSWINTSSWSRKTSGRTSGRAGDLLPPQHAHSGKWANTKYVRQKFGHPMYTNLLTSSLDIRKEQYGCECTHYTFHCLLWADQLVAEYVNISCASPKPSTLQLLKAVERLVLIWPPPHNTRFGIQAAIAARSIPNSFQCLAT